MQNEQKVLEIDEKARAILLNHDGLHGRGYKYNIERSLKVKSELQNHFLFGQEKRKMKIKTEQANFEEVFTKTQNKMRSKWTETKNKLYEACDQIALENPEVPHQISRMTGSTHPKLQSKEIVNLSRKTAAYYFFACNVGKGLLAAISENNVKTLDGEKYSIIDFITHLVIDLKKSVGHFTGEQSFFSIYKINNFVEDKQNIALASDIREEILGEIGTSPKITKAIKPVLSHFFGDEFAGFINDLISIIIQDSAELRSEDIEVVLSTDPLDYVAVSIAEGWDSCLYPGKEYSSGGTSLMTDDSTMVAYVPSKNTDYIIERIHGETGSFHIDNKKSRMLVHAIRDSSGEIVGIKANRQYPRDNRAFDGLIQVLAEENGYKSFDFHQKADYEFSDFMYNDFKSNDIGYADPDILDTMGLMHVFIGSSIHCSMCGERMHEIDPDFSNEDWDRQGLCYECALENGMNDCDEDCDYCGCECG